MQLRARTVEYSSTWYVFRTHRRDEAKRGISVSLGRVLILVENLSVPFDRRVWQESVSLRRAGFDVVVISPQGHKFDREKFEVLDGVDIHRYRLVAATGNAFTYLREYGVAFWRTATLVLRLGLRRRFDVVHACNPPDFLLLAALPLKLRGTRFVFDQHDLVPELYLSRFKSRRNLLYRTTRLLETMTFRLADVVISTNESYRNVALSRGRKSPDDVFVVRSAPDLDRFKQAEPDESLKRGKAFLLVYLGVMGPQDGVDHALRALALLAERRQDWHATFVGDGDARPAMLSLARELGLQEVEFPGRIPDDELALVLSTADVCLAPDPKNPLNDVSTMNKIVEYMAMARPIVSYDLIEARVSAADAALYAEPNDPRSFAAAVAELLDAPERRAAMGVAGRARVEQELSWSQSEEALLAAYARALVGRKHR
jgi:glycosyltransferase involved in cell wall biosynthesis